MKPWRNSLNIQQLKKRTKMRQEESKEKAAKHGNLNQEEELLDMDELMDVQGGTDTEPVKNCGLGCYLSGINNTGQGSTNADENDKP